MGTKIISSRESDESIAERLQGISILLNDIAEVTEEPPEEVPSLLSQLELNLLLLGVQVEELRQSQSVMYSDILTLSVQNAEMMHDLNNCAALLLALTDAPSSHDLITDAVDIMRHAGDAKIDTTLSDDVDHNDETEAMILDVQVSFSEDGLRKGLAAAITQYNNLLSSRAAKMFRQQP